MKNYYLTTETAKHLQHKENIWNLLKDCFWCKNIPLECIERFIPRSLCFSVILTDVDELIGFARVISDYTTYAYVCDVVVDPLHRRRGYGKELMNSIMSHPELQNLKTWSLRTTDEASEIYMSHGFVLAADPETQLEINDLQIYIRRN